MHEQHVKWQHDHEAWLGDIDEWKKELNLAFADLSEVKIAIRDSLDALESHANTIVESQQAITAQEHVISEMIRTGESKTREDLEATHAQHNAEHEQINEAHQRIKKHHHSVIAEFARLLKKYREAV